MGLIKKTYYVYALIDPRDDVVRYIGRGTGLRYRWCLFCRCKRQKGVEPWLLCLRRLKMEPRIVKIVEGLTKVQASCREIELITTIGRQPDGPLLNIEVGGNLGREPGFKHSFKTRRKMSESAKGRTMGAKTRRKIAKSNTGKVQSETTCQKRSKSNTGKTRTVATRLRMSKAAKARGISIKTRRKMSKTRKGKKRGPMSAATKAKISKANKGCKHSADSCRNMSKAHKGKVLSKLTRQRISKSGKDKKRSPATCARIRKASLKREADRRVARKQ